MDVIINILIVVFVISSVLKRFQEVAKKSGEVTRPSPPSGERSDIPPLPHVIGDATPELSTEPVAREAASEPEVRSLKDLVEYLKDEYQQAATPASPPEIPTAMVEPEPALPVVDQALPAVAMARNERMVDSAYRAISPSLTFSREQMVNGIILSEVLGPPVALRSHSGSGMW